MQFESATSSTILFGAGKLRSALPALLKSSPARPLVVTGRDARRAEPLLALLREHHLAFTTFPVSGEPSVETIRDGLSLAKREQCDWVIGIGGGSVIDAGKAIAAMLRNEGDVLDYLEIIGLGQALREPSARYLAVPTTAGTGSEVTRNAVLASPGHRLKVSLRSAGMLPAVALVDPELTYDLPPRLTASTGLDALTQLIEPFVCSRANPLTDALCLDGIPRVAQSLRAAAKEGRDPQARADMALASLFGGMALANAGLGAVHGFAGPIGGMYAAPHGEICAALLPYVMSANLQALRRRAPHHAATERYDHVARLLTGRPTARAEDGIAWVHELVSDLQIPRLRTHGIEPGHSGEIVKHAQNASSMKANPIALTETELAEILQNAL